MSAHIVEGGDQLSESARPLRRTGGSGVCEIAPCSSAPCSGATARSNVDPDWLPAPLQTPGAPPQLAAPSAQLAAAAQAVAVGGAARKCSGGPACLRPRSWRCCRGGVGRLSTSGSGSAPPRASRSSPKGSPSASSSSSPGRRGGGSISDADSRRAEKSEGGRPADAGEGSAGAAMGEGGASGVGARSLSSAAARLKGVPRLKGVVGVLASSSCARSLVRVGGRLRIRAGVGVRIWRG